MSLEVLNPSSVARASAQPDCLSNLSVCGASCCKSVSFRLTKEMARALKEGAAEYFIGATLSPDLRFYYQLHGFQPERNGLKVLLFPGNHEVRGEILIIYRRCDWLDEDLKCKHHDRKPLRCKDLNYRTASAGRYTITQGCLLEARNG